MNKNQPVPAHDEVQAVIRNLRCIAKTVLSSEARSSMRADLESAIRLLATRPAQTEQQPIRLPERLDVPKLEDEAGGCRSDSYTQRVMAAKAWNSALDAVTRLSASPIAQTAPQPEQSGLVDALTQLLCWAEKQVCTHEETHRGGAIWEICDSCGAKWADDEGGRPAFVWPKAVSEARAALSAQGESHE